MNYYEIKNLIDFIKEQDRVELKKLRNKKYHVILLEYLESELSSFDYEKNDSYDILKQIFKPLSMLEYNSTERNYIYNKLQDIRFIIKELLVNKPKDIDKGNENYKILKKCIDRIEILSLSILYNHQKKYSNKKIELAKFIIFEIKNINILKDYFLKYPYLINFLEEENKEILLNLIYLYIESLKKHIKDKKNGYLDELLYYEEALNGILKAPKLKLSTPLKYELIEILNKEISNSSSEYTLKQKNRFIFFINMLLFKIEGLEYEYDIESLSYKYDIDLTFNKAVELETSNICFHIKKSNKEDRNEYIYTFDKENTKDYDDGLSISYKDGIYHLGIHIADPLKIIPVNSIVFDEAYHRTTSIYLPGKTLNMYPEIFSTDLFSLKEKHYRNVRSYYFDIDAQNGQIINEYFEKKYAFISKNCTYNQFEKILKRGTNDIQLEKAIYYLSKIGILLKNYFKFDDLYIEKNRVKDNVTSTNIIGNTSGEKVVESAMVFVNHRIAKYFSDRNYPFPYRNHILNKKYLEELKKYREIFKKDSSNKDVLAQIDFMMNMYPKSYYESVSRGHNGIGVPCYSHVTSPIRRMADNIANICQDKLYFNNPNTEKLKVLRDFVQKSCEYINNKSIATEKFYSEYAKKIYALKK